MSPFVFPPCLFLVSPARLHPDTSRYRYRTPPPAVLNVVVTKARAADVRSVSIDMYALARALLEEVQVEDPNPNMVIGLPFLDSFILRPSPSNLSHSFCTCTDTT
ncbi:hypothetical protein K438DRAFT_1960063 [Mycena galopus ATCC 62051]|nr:hypothetical protein K438DRAFT_1960063 [Mycena galopus ATCC 62051]